MEVEYDWFWEETDVSEGESETNVEDETSAEGEMGQEAPEV